MTLYKLSTMEIQDIKQQLTIAQVFTHYNLKADRNTRLNCPFHEDKTPSMQVYYKTNTVYCFSSNCTTHGKSLDVIDFILHKENCSKHEAIKKAENLITGDNASTGEIIDREQFLKRMFTYFKNAVYNSSPAKEYLKHRNLDPTKLEIGYNSGQFHHGLRKDESLINNSVAAGLLARWGINGRRPGEPAYAAFAKLCIVFALKNKDNQITGLYFRSTVNNDTQKHFYLKGRQGIYPNYPKPDTKKLILTEAIIDAATLLQIQEIAEQYSIIACFGTNGMNEEIKAAILELQNLEEVIFAFDMDEAGTTAAIKYSQELKQHLPKATFTKLELPCKDINETAQAHQDESIFTHLFQTRSALYFFQKKMKIKI
jgi:DNA primase